ncbi:MAG: hypothetical protein JWP59_1832 [Massilia sp.]|nr:hypothetical protein [Massilia sp.]
MANHLTQIIYRKSLPFKTVSDPPLCSARRHHAAADRHRIDRRLVSGGLLFGVGWGLAGYCPGPALASLASGGAKPLIFAAAMVAGMVIFIPLERVSLQRRHAA